MAEKTDAFVSGNLTRPVDRLTSQGSAFYQGGKSAETSRVLTEKDKKLAAAESKLNSQQPDNQGIPPLGQ